MGTEIERKFLVSNDTWRREAVGVPYTQGYISRESGRTVRIRIAGEKGFLTIKGPVKGISRAEFEYSIPLDDARELLQLCHAPVIKKIRSRILFEGKLWEIDEFKEANLGLVIAEIELAHPGEEFSLPSWLGKEVTEDSRYYNSNLTNHPFCQWSGHPA